MIDVHCSAQTSVSSRHEECSRRHFQVAAFAELLEVAASSKARGLTRGHFVHDHITAVNLKGEQHHLDVLPRDHEAHKMRLQLVHSLHIGRLVARKLCTSTHESSQSAKVAHLKADDVIGKLEHELALLVHILSDEAAARRRRRV